jgi:hypothetical protein
VSDAQNVVRQTEWKKEIDRCRRVDAITKETKEVDVTVWSGSFRLRAQYTGVLTLTR